MARRDERIVSDTRLAEPGSASPASQPTRRRAADGGAQTAGGRYVAREHPPPPADRACEWAGRGRMSQMRQ